MDRLTDARAELRAIEQKILGARARLKELEEGRRALLLAPWRVEVGGIVLGTHRSAAGKRCLVTRVDTPLHLNARPWLTARVETKTGGFARTEICLMDDWRHCDPEAGRTRLNEEERRGC